MNEPTTATVLIVDDEPDVADLYATWVGDEHDVRTAYDGDEALDYVDADVDVAFLDRQMPGRSGDDVLEAIEDRELDCRTVMVTAIDPDFDIVDLPFDDYLTKPVTRDDLLETIDEMLVRTTYDERMQEYFAMVSKKATLEAQKHAAELDANETYREISTRVEELRARADEAVSDIDDLESVFRDLRQ